MQERSIQDLRVKHYAILALVGWTVLVAAFAGLSYSTIISSIEESAHSKAQAVFNKDQAFRFWGTLHGGVYVPETRTTPPNPYLKHIPERDITTPSGKRLTLINPAYMTRQLNERFSGLYGAFGHITSLKPLRPENGPDPWERKALLAFESGAREVSERIELEGQSYLRLMRPMGTTKGCLKCHSHQGYKVGDVRGGVGVLVPMKPFIDANRGELQVLGFATPALWIFGLVVIVLGWRNLSRNQRARNRLEQGLREEEEKYRFLVENQNDLIVRFNQDALILFANQQYCDTFGKSLDELLGTSFVPLIHEEDRQAVDESLASLHHPPHATYHEERVMLGGAWRWFGWSAKGILDSQGKLKEIVSVGRDIDDGKRDEALLKEYRSVIENGRDIVAVVDRDYCYTMVNEAFLQQRDLTREEVIGRNARDILGPRMFSLLEARLQRCFTGKSDLFELEETYPNLGERIIEVRYFPISDSEGEVVRVAAMITDVTDSRRVERALGEAERKWRTILVDVPQIGVSLDTKGKIIFANDYFLELTGWREQEVMGQNWFDMFIPLDVREQVRDVFHTVMSRKEAASLSTFENEILTKSGEHRHVAWSNVVTKDTRGEIIDVTSMGVDLTERQRVQQGLMEAMEAAEAANRMKTEFLATMSHEIRTPLNGIMGMLQLAQTTDLNPEMQVYIDTALGASRNLLRILTDILELSRIEAGAVEIQKTTFLMKSIVDPVLGSFEEEATNKGVELEIEVDPAVPDCLVGDEGRIRQVLFNLMGNAVKYTKQGLVRLEIYLVPSAPDSPLNVHFAVIDTGIGIKEDRLDQVWEPFTQVDGSFTREYGGTGLGLSIVKRLIKVMNGTVSMHSEYGQGTQIHLTLPLEKPRGAARLACTPDEHAPRGQSSRVLLAEDDVVNQVALSSLLKKSGFDVEVAANGREVLDVLEEQSFDVILMDINMPVMDGVEATKLIRSKQTAYADIPIVAMTAYAMAGDRESFLRAGMDDYLAKPVTIEALREMIERYTDSQSDKVQ